MSKHT